MRPTFKDPILDGSKDPILDPKKDPDGGATGMVKPKGGG